MATGQTLLQLIGSHQRRNEEGFRAAVMRLIAEEQNSQHFTLARELERILAQESSPPTGKEVAQSFHELPRDRERNTLLLEVRQPQRALSDVVLSEESRASLEETVEEFQRIDLLRSHGLRPKRTLLFYGPPGCGKTLCAEALANELGLPMLYTRFDGLISSYLGETAANLRKVFDFAAKGTWVLFFDEFDAVGKSRDNTGESGELKRVVNSFLQMLDGFQSTSYFIAATNHEQLLDSALWRRFDDILYFGMPDIEQITTLIQHRLAVFPNSIDIQHAAASMMGLSFADIEHVCLEAIKRCILKRRKSLDETGFSQTLQRFRLRLKRMAEATPTNILE